MFGDFLGGTLIIIFMVIAIAIDLAYHAFVRLRRRRRRRRLLDAVDIERAVCVYLITFGAHGPPGAGGFSFSSPRQPEQPSVKTSDGRVFFSFAGFISHGERFAEVSVPIPLSGVHKALDATANAVARYAEYYNMPNVNINDRAAIMDALNRGYYDTGGSWREVMVRNWQWQIHTLQQQARQINATFQDQESVFATFYAEHPTLRHETQGDPNFFNSFHRVRRAAMDSDNATAQREFSALQQQLRALDDADAALLMDPDLDAAEQSALNERIREKRGIFLSIVLAVLSLFGTAVATSITSRWTSRDIQDAQRRTMLLHGKEFKHQVMLGWGQQELAEVAINTLNDMKGFEWKEAVSAKVNSALGVIRSHLDMVFDTLSHSKNRNCPLKPFLSEQVGRVLHELVVTAQKQGMTPLFTRLSDVLQHGCTFQQKSDGFAVTVHVPLVTTSSVFTVYRHHPLPIEVGPGEHLTVLPGRYSHIIINDDQSLFAATTWADLHECDRVGRYYSCDAGSVLRKAPTSADSTHGKDGALCLYALITGRYELAKGVCETHKARPEHAAIQVGTNRFATYDSEPSLAQITCPGRASVNPFTLQALALIHLPAGCSADTDDYSLASSQVHLREASAADRDLSYDWPSALVDGNDDSLGMSQFMNSTYVRNLLKRIESLESVAIEAKQVQAEARQELLQLHEELRSPPAIVGFIGIGLAAIALAALAALLYFSRGKLRNIRGNLEKGLLNVQGKISDARQELAAMVTAATHPPTAPPPTVPRRQPPLHPQEALHEDAASSHELQSLK